jgi:hypothetical protein
MWLVRARVRSGTSELRRCFYSASSAAGILRGAAIGSGAGEGVLRDNRVRASGSAAASGNADIRYRNSIRRCIALAGYPIG